MFLLSTCVAVISASNQEFSEMSAMDGVLNDVLNSDEHSKSDEFGNETIDHESVNDSDVEIISSSSTNGPQLRRYSCSSREHEGDHEITDTMLGVTQPQNNSFLSSLKVPKASSLSRKQAQARNPPSRKRRCRGTSANAFMVK